VRLWNSGTCPYAQRAWLALLEKDVEFEHKIVDLQNKPDDFVALYASLHPEPTARAKVPILEHCTTDSSPSSLPSSSSPYNVQLIESSVCAEYIAEAFPNSQGSALLPSLPRDKAIMRLLGEMWTLSGMGNYFPLLLAGQAEKEGEEAHAVEVEKMQKGMKLMDAFLRQYGCDVKESPFLLKSGFCLGEVCLAPFVQRLLIVVPHWAGVNLLEMAEKGGWGRLRVWMEAVAGRESTIKSGGTKEETIKNYTRLLAMMKGGGVGGGGGGATTTKK